MENLDKVLEDKNHTWAVVTPNKEVVRWAEKRHLVVRMPDGHPVAVPCTSCKEPIKMVDELLVVRKIKGNVIRAIFCGVNCQRQFRLDMKAFHKKRLGY